ncbi:hypothetical protein GCM10011575_47460 [Microlunatus endophyticus]|uniref:Uncharacterized protein n=1 Tax=Microlunatus endophyticus TaxID=1716077 RepID=A0A917SI59_9ACTN|nr:hypothetical protein [Microlunatus endophyticus]GGL83627.1 hypothetical protein GCM10011575_47460 [Microlunatus endophyticus]
MPDWLVIAIAVATPLLGFIGVLLGQLLTRQGARELDVWRRREETMRMLRWAAELTMQPESGALGLSVLDSLSRSELLQPADQPLISAVLATVTARAEAIYTEEEATGGIDEHTDND